MGSVPVRPEAAVRSIGMLRTAMGAITSWLDDPAIVEVMLNPDGRLWIDRLAGGLSDTGKRLSAQDGERIVRVVAHHVGAEVHPGSPRISAELPVHGERFEGLLPPIVAAPTFAIRKPAVAIFTLTDYAKAGIVTAGQAEFLREAVAQRRNILVAGGTSTGKTTLVNALLAEVAGTADRVILIEDTRELKCSAPNLVALRTKDGVASLSDLVRSSLRLRPDHIPVGEGGIGTIHAGSATGALPPARTAHPGSRRHGAAGADRGAAKREKRQKERRGRERDRQAEHDLDQAPEALGDEPVPRTCRECGRAMLGNHRVFCSRKCAVDNYRARSRSSSAEALPRPE
jgi:type IV secretion system protein TrbB